MAYLPAESRYRSMTYRRCGASGLRLPAVKERVYVPEAAIDKFAVAVPCDRDEQIQRAETILRDAGAAEVRQQAGDET